MDFKACLYPWEDPFSTALCVCLQDEMVVMDWSGGGEQHSNEDKQKQYGKRS